MTLRKRDTDNIAILLKYIKDGLQLVYANSYKKHCYFILINFIIDYKKQVFIINIKANIQYLICYILIKKRKLVIWL